MAVIIRAAAVAPVSRQLRRPGAPALAAATPAAAAAAADAPSPAPPAVAAVAEAVLAVPAPAAPAVPEPQWAARAAALAEAEAQVHERAAALAQREQQVQQRALALQQQEAALADAQRALHARSGGVIEDARQRGLELGRAAAEQEVAEQLAARSERITAVLNAVQQERRAALEQHEDMLVEIVFAAVCRLLGAAAASRSAVASMVHSLTAQEREPGQVRVRLHPQDLATLEAPGGLLDARLSLLPDPSIELGGCLIDSPRGTLDARLELQLERLREELLAVRRAAATAEAPV